MSSDDDGGYVHRPGNADGRSATGDDAPGAAAATGDNAATDPEGFGTRGWVLVGVLAACTLVVPGIIYLRPGVLAAVGIPYVASLLVLPLLPAVALGLTAVWAMTAATRDEE